MPGVPELSGRRLKIPGLFVTGTDTGVGKTVVACAMAAAIRQQEPGIRLGAFKPVSSGCRKDREGLVSEDAEALAHFTDLRLPLDVINPIRFSQPLAPAVAAEQAGTVVDFLPLQRSLQNIEAHCDALVIEGVGGLLVPLDWRSQSGGPVTVLDLIGDLGYPVVVVARSTMGTLNHTALTTSQLRGAGCRVIGVVINPYDGDVAAAEDPTMQSNRVSIERLTGAKVLAVVPRVKPAGAMPHRGSLDPAIVDALATVRWLELMSKPR